MGAGVVVVTINYRLSTLGFLRCQHHHSGHFILLKFVVFYPLSPSRLFFDIFATFELCLSYPTASQPWYSGGAWKHGDAGSGRLSDLHNPKIYFGFGDDQKSEPFRHYFHT